MTAPIPATIVEWQLEADSDISVSVQIADDNYERSSNVITIRDEDTGGTVNVYRAAVEELVAALREAVER